MNHEIEQEVMKKALFKSKEKLHRDIKKIYRAIYLKYDHEDCNISMW